MALNFPDNPSIDQVYSDETAGFYYLWDGTVWQSFSPSSSNTIKILDDFSSGFTGVAQTFALTSGGIAVLPIDSKQLVINLGGVIQDPSDDYSVSGSNIIFSTPPGGGLSFSGISLGQAIPISDILDGSITPAKLSIGGLSWNTSGDVSISGSQLTLPSVVVGGAQTALVVKGDARITGILTVGTESITLNGNSSRIDVGSDIILDGATSKINVGSGITFNGSTGIIGATEFRGNGANLTGVQPFASGTAIIFSQTAAPTGWTKSTTHHNKALRVVNTSGGGSGGSVGFTTAFASRSGVGTVAETTLSTTQIPSHNHTTDYRTGISAENNTAVRGGSGSGVNPATSSTGGGGSHTHGFALTMDFDVQYVDTIICTKD